MALSEAPAREERTGWELAAQMMEVARGQCYGECEVGGMTKRQEERNGRHAEAEDDVDIVWVGRQEGGAACAEDIDTTAEDSVEKTAAWAVPSANGSMDNLVVASCSAAWAGRAFHVCDDHQASAAAHKAGLTRDSYSLETWQRLPRPHDDIGPREVNDRRGSAYQVLNSPADDSWLTKRTLSVPKARAWYSARRCGFMRFPAAVEG